MTFIDNVLYMLLYYTIEKKMSFFYKHTMYKKYAGSTEHEIEIE